MKKLLTDSSIVWIISRRFIKSDVDYKDVETRIEETSESSIDFIESL